jgi:integrase
MNDIAGFNWKKICSFIGENIKTVRDRPYTREEISKLLDAAQDKRLKITILLMCGSRLRIGSICELKICNLEPIIKYGIYQITVYENTKQEYITFCTQNLLLNTMNLHPWTKLGVRYRIDIRDILIQY